MLACLIHGWVSTKTWRWVDPYITDSWLILIPPTVSRSIRQLSPWASLSGLLVDTWPILDQVSTDTREYWPMYWLIYQLIYQSIHWSRSPIIYMIQTSWVYLHYRQFLLICFFFIALEKATFLELVFLCSVIYGKYPHSWKDTKMATRLDFCRGMSWPVNWYCF